MDKPVTFEEAREILRRATFKGYIESQRCFLLLDACEAERKRARELLRMVVAHRDIADSIGADEIRAFLERTAK